MGLAIAQAGGFLNASEVVRLTFFTWVNEQLGMTSMCGQISGLLGTPPTLGDLAIAAQDNVDTTLQLLCGLNVDILGCKATAARKGLGILPGVATSTSIGSGALSLPGQVSGLLSFTTLGSGRSQRGRMYMPFPKSDKIDTDGTPTAVYVGDMAAFATNMGVGAGGFAGVGAGGGLFTFTPAIYHRATDTSSVIATFVPKKLWATQKRRGDYGRVNAKAIPF